MSDEFKIDNAKLEKISATFAIPKDEIHQLKEAYDNFSPYLKGQPLAHVMRGIECYFRKQMKNTRFIVICEPYGEFYEGQKQASALYFAPNPVIRSNDKQNSSFIINYNANLPEKEHRDYIAHEIGHLFLAVYKKSIKRNPPTKKRKDITEPLSSIFGIFTMSEKNDFYANCTKSGRNHNNWTELLDHFLKIHKGENTI